MSEVDTGAVVEAAVADLKESNPGIGEETADTSSETPETTGEAAETPKADADPNEESELAELQKELVTKNPNIRGKIDVARHQAVLTRTRNRYEQQIAEARKEAERFKQYEAADFQSRLKAFEISEQDPDRFLEILGSVPEYKSRLEARIAEAIKAAQAPALKEEEPKPDVLNPDGTLGFTPETAQKLIDFRVRQALAEQQKKYDERFEALDNDLKPVREQQKAIQDLNESIGRQSTRLENAREYWPGFKENEAKVTALMLQPGNERMSLEAAYGHVVYPMRDQMRADVVKEMSEKSRATKPTLRPGLPEATADPDTPEANDTESIVRRELAKLKQ